MGTEYLWVINSDPLGFRPVENETKNETNTQRRK